MEAFVRVVEAGSFVAAADRLGISTSSLSRMVADLEQHLGTRLLHRTTRRLSLTESGQAYYERCVTLLADVAEAEAIAGQSAAQARGTVRLTCSYSMAEQTVAPAIAAFVERHPAVKFELVVSDRIVDLVEEGFDLAIRVGNVGSDRLVARRLGSMQLVLCAAPAYLERHGAPAVAADLARHNALTYAYSASPRVWRFHDVAGERPRRTRHGQPAREQWRRAARGGHRRARNSLRAGFPARIRPARGVNSSGCCPITPVREGRSGRSIRAAATSR